MGQPKLSLDIASCLWGIKAPQIEKLYSREKDVFTVTTQVINPHKRVFSVYQRPSGAWTFWFSPTKGTDSLKGSLNNMIILALTH